MRKIKIQPPDTTKWKRWDKKCQKATKENWEKIDQNEKLVFDENLYKKYKEFFIDTAFHGKCGYCECPVKDFQHGDVEHFRPKAKVTDEKDETIDHPGYHWLAYNWQNLLVSCQKCNQISKWGNQKIGKGCRFPVLEIHAQTPETINKEKPLLINPTSNLPEDLPSKHLAITPDGYLQGLTDRGKMCIQVFGLNLRDQLVEDRHRAYLQALVLKKQLHSESKEDQQRAINKIIVIIQGKKSYSIAQIEAVKAFKDLLGIEKAPGVCGGSACIAGTRITVWGLVESRRIGYSEADLLTSYPTLTATNLANAWAYAATFSDEIEAEIAENNAVMSREI